MNTTDDRRNHAALVDDDMIWQEIIVRSDSVVEVKALVEAWEGVAAVFAERAGQLTLAAPKDRAAELSDLLAAIAEITEMAPPDH